MLKWFKQLDEILRGDATRMSLLAEGQIKTRVAGLSVAVVLLGVFYGLCMGSFTMIRTSGEAYMQLIASIGNPAAPTQFFRQDAWGNAYVRLAHVLWTFLGG